MEEFSLTLGHGTCNFPLVGFFLPLLRRDRDPKPYSPNLDRVYPNLPRPEARFGNDGRLVFLVFPVKMEMAGFA